jgi:hypothetical protein
MVAPVEKGAASLRAGWRPVLAGPKAASIVELAQRVARDALASELAPSELPMLSRGALGSVLLLRHLEVIGRPVDDHGSGATLRRAAQELPRTRLGPGLWVGFSGLAWAAGHVGNGPGSEQLRARLRGWLATGGGEEYDLIAGVAGIGRLALDCRDRELLELVVTRLAALSEERPAGISWRTPATRWTARSHASFDLGVAHGVAGVIGLLASVAGLPDPPLLASTLLRGSVDWMLAQRRQPTGEGWFPSTTEDDGSELPPARLGWCYGDAGILVVLARAARVLGDDVLLGEIGEMARSSAARRGEDAGVVDAGLCHGAAGLGHLFGRLHALVGGAACAGAARYWLQHALALRRPVDGCGDFPAWRIDPNSGGRYEASFALLTGATGVALALLSACTAHEPEWDRILLAS